MLIRDAVHHPTSLEQVHHGLHPEALSMAMWWFVVTRIRLSAFTTIQRAHTIGSPTMSWMEFELRLVMPMSMIVSAFTYGDFLIQLNELLPMPAHIWITGGEPQNFGNPRSTSQIATPTGLIPGPPLPRPMARHCAVQLNETHTILIGGIDNTSNYVYNHQEQTWLVSTGLSIGFLNEVNFEPSTAN